MLSSISLITDDVAESARFFRDILGLLTTGDDGYVEVAAGPIVLSIMRGAMVDIGAPDGVILQFETEDLDKPLAAARQAGLVLAEPQRTDWGTESAYLRGPGRLVVELFRKVA